MKFYFTSNDFLRFCNAIDFFTSHDFVNRFSCPLYGDEFDFWIRQRGFSFDFTSPFDHVEVDDPGFSPSVSFGGEFIKFPKYNHCDFLFYTSRYFLEQLRDHLERWFLYVDPDFLNDSNVFFFDVEHFSLLGGPFICCVGYCDKSFRHHSGDRVFLFGGGKKYKH